ncbi:MAG: hypothetical protein LBD28_06110 [Tannerellaceae bacterium]|nr:hypothetical protein [Tannerellaceae bacterium]
MGKLVRCGIPSNTPKTFLHKIKVPTDLDLRTGGYILQQMLQYTFQSRFLSIRLKLKTHNRTFTSTVMD